MTRYLLVALVSAWATLIAWLSIKRHRHPSYRKTVLMAPGLAGYWPLNDVMGPTARDLVGGDDGTYLAAELRDKAG